MLPSSSVGARPGLAPAGALHRARPASSRVGSRRIVSRPRAIPKFDPTKFKILDLLRGESKASEPEGPAAKEPTYADAAPSALGEELAPEPTPTAKALVPTPSQTAALSSASDAWSPLGPSFRPPGSGQKETLGDISAIPDHDGTDCLKWDPTLWSHADHFRYRWNVFKSVRDAIDANEGGLEAFSRGYEKMGINRGVDAEGREGLWYREWAPNAKALALVGDFNEWSPKDEHWAIKNPFGVWELFLPDDPTTGAPAVPHRTRVKARLETAAGEWVDRIPAWIRWATQAPHKVPFDGVHWAPDGKPGEPGVYVEGSPYVWKHPRPPRPRDLRIYECHVGMSSQEPKVNSYLEFARDVLPRVRKLGYNAIQLMAVQEHAYYGSFGYHVTNFFAVSSRCGTPDELKALIDAAHGMGLTVLMDIVHSHASRNVQDGINEFDGSDGGYFHSGARGYHWMWDSRCFDYGNWETLRFLLSNARWWIEEYRFDGFRFDGVTSMMYHHHGLQTAFTGSYDEYFGTATDVDAVVYLMLANNTLHDLFPSLVTVGEDVSGMPSFCRPWTEGGVGFDYRLNMAIADKWIELLKKPDEDWQVGDIAHTLTNRRYAEPCVAYAESHDQALVGDKTIAFWLMDAAMYDGMALSVPESPAVSRGIALHKMIRLVTIALGGESYLTFMGNEFGHPEWIDFPRDDTYDTSTGAFVPGNGGSLEKCRRRWDLADDEGLRYKYMQAFDRAFMHLDKAFGFVAARHQWVSRKDEGDKLIVLERGDLVFVFNFHPTRSFTDYRIGCEHPGPYKVVLSSDETVFGGYANVAAGDDVVFHTEEREHDNRPRSMLVYAPSRTCVVYAPADFVDSQAPYDGAPKYAVPGLAVKGLGPYFDV